MNQENFISYSTDRREHWDSIANYKDHWQSKGAYYHNRLRGIYQFIVNPNQRVLEIGCGKGDLLASLKPSYGLGIDFSYEHVKRAKNRHPGLHFLVADAHSITLKKKFDVIILSDLLNDLWDVQEVIAQTKQMTAPHTRIILNLYSHLWESPLKLFQKLKLATKIRPQNWLTIEDVANLLYIEDIEVIRSWPEIIWPLGTPLLSLFCNKILARLWPFKHLCLTNILIARPRVDTSDNKSISVIIAARNEAGNIPDLFKRIPQMGRHTEIIFVEGNSKDNTFGVIEEHIKKHPEIDCKLFKQQGAGKGDAVRLGFSKASGDILMILDADMTVPPEDLPRFYQIIKEGKAEFVNGVRLVYPMEKKAMRFFNLIGNKTFSLLFSWLLGQQIKDTLCGTKVISKENYHEIEKNRSYFGEFDPFGDFDLIFGAAKSNLKIVDLPVRYRERKYGDTNIERWKHGLLLLRMVIFAARRIKFI